MSRDHVSELLVGLQPLPLQLRAPALEELLAQTLARVIPPLTALSSSSSVTWPANDAPEDGILPARLAGASATPAPNGGFSIHSGVVSRSRSLALY